ncbi:hypothetical protein C8F04DRAFT_1267040 [Mycena alexandri]|uniref:Uncharacterized protein n=1 Tax=Mycena alexandri TaxID=1745969 RepID=A0AAD6SI88_9AGAR|nr:hypothetical protein C8F04DRAFT_1267040 [Mycena alexandri]
MSPNQGFYPPSPLPADVRPPPNFIPCKIPDHLGHNFSDHVDFTRLGNKRYWILFWPKKPAGMYSLKTDVTTAAQLAGAAAGVPGVVESYSGWQQVSAAWAQHCWVRHTRCEQHPNACTEGECPAHPPPSNPEVIKVSKRSVKQENAGEPAKRIKSEAPQSSALRSSVKRRMGRHAPVAGSSDDDVPGRVPLYDPDTPPDTPARQRGDSQRPPEEAPVSQPPAARTGEGPSVVGLERLRAAQANRSGTGATASTQDASSFRSAVPSSSASAAPSSTTPSSASSLTASTVAPEPIAGTDASWMAGLDTRALGVALRDDPFFVGPHGRIWHSSTGAFDEVVDGPVQVVIGWAAATELAVELVRARATGKGKGKARVVRMEVDGV